MGMYYFNVSYGYVDYDGTKVDEEEEYQFPFNSYEDASEYRDMLVRGFEGDFLLHDEVWVESYFFRCEDF